MIQSETFFQNRIVNWPQRKYVRINFIYLSSLGAFAIAAYFMEKLAPRKVFYGVVFVYLAFYSTATVKYNYIWQDPIKFYSRIIRLSPGSADAYNNLGVFYLNERDFIRAEAMIKKTLELNPRSADARLNLARLHYFKNDYPKAIELVREAVKIEPGNFMAYIYLGAFYYHDQKLAQAEEAYKKALSLNPSFESAREELNFIYQESRKSEQAQ